MKVLNIIPNGWPCTLLECPPGFFVFNERLCFKSEYLETGSSNPVEMEVFCESGEYFWGGTETKKERAELIVQPVITEWKEVFI